MSASIGKVFEGEFKKVLDLLKTTHHVAWHRMADTAAAGNVIAEQPSDFFVGLPPGSVAMAGQRFFLLEVKASEESHSLGKAMMTPSQRGAINRWRMMLNIPYYVLFWDAQLGNMQLWDGIAVVRESNMSKQRDMLAQWPNCGVVKRLRHEYVAQRLVDHFQIPEGKATLADAQRRM